MTSQQRTSWKPTEVAKKISYPTGDQKSTKKWQLDFVFEGDKCPHSQTVSSAFWGVCAPNNRNPRWFYHKVEDTVLIMAVRISSMEQRGNLGKKQHFYIRGKIGTQPTDLSLERERHPIEMPFVGYYWPLRPRLEIRAFSHQEDGSDILDLAYLRQFKPHAGYGEFKP